MNKTLEARGISNLIERKLRCVNNKGKENRLTINKEYISLYDYLDDLYCLKEDDNGTKKQVFPKNLFEKLD